MQKIRQFSVIFTVVIVVFAAVKGQTGPYPADLDYNFGAIGTGISFIQGSGSTAQLAVTANDEIVVNHTWSISLTKPNGGTRKIVNCPFASCGAMALQGNNYVVWAGITANGELGITRLDLRFNTDLTFGTNGRAIYRISNSAFSSPTAMIIQGTQIIIVGNAGVAGDPKQFVAKFNGNGTPDFSFGGLGYTLETTIGLTAHSVALQWNNIVVGGLLADKYGFFTTVTVYDGAGFRQINFNQGNILTLPGLPGMVAVQPDNKIVLAGFLASGVNRQAVGRLNIDGSFDYSFGQGGTVTAPVDEPSQIRTTAIDPVGRIVTAGNWDELTPTYSRKMLIARYTSDGTLDKDFTYTNPQPDSPFGWRIIFFNTVQPHNFNGIGFQSTGKIVVGGQIGNSTISANNSIYRFNGN